ncbi:allantoicase [Dactylosporangium matsuzakiense]|uniref:Probable allantoicase n=1 Tax=Dactylosporangium matsuzakiense TaxID=53360 RepID=A0A9W6KE14_9ACTN|nr:allantoicase [Dactylosporangium matsuzakiense]UWZ47012.1 allantoicase [Dactylosporangium matsuzakiense]GLK98565.1 putative allantoicase [Dactylosporangium matsuzakiense]
MTFTDLTDLASRLLGGGVVAANDEFFAAMDNLVNPAPSQFETWTYGPKGKVYDGWETRRRRTPGHDWAIVRLGAPGQIHGVVVDTAHFTGNFPPFASVDAAELPGHPSPADLAAADWTPIVPKSPLKGDNRNHFPVVPGPRHTHVRLNIFPDGGVARLRVHGVVAPDPALLHGLTVNLAAMELGAVVAGCSDMFYGSPGNLLLPDRARQMSEGWETARRREPGNEWVLVRLAAAGRVRLVELDTTHFKGNAPGSAALRATADPGDETAWFDLVPQTPLQPDTRHFYRIDSPHPATHVRLDIHPDGGLARLRVWGETDG